VHVCVCPCLFLFIIQCVLQLLDNWVPFHGIWYGLQHLCSTFNNLQSVTGGAVGSGTALPAGKSRVRFPMDSPEIDPASDKNEYQEYFLWCTGCWGVQLTSLALCCADCLEIWEPQSAGTLKGLSRLVLVRESLITTLAYSSGRAVWGLDLWPLACWYCGFEFRRGHCNCLCESRVSSGSGFCVGLITRPECVCVCVWVWSWNLDNAEALAHCGLLLHLKNNSKVGSRLCEVE